MEHEIIAVEQQLSAFAEYLFLEEKSNATREKYIRDVRAFLSFLEGAKIRKELVLSWKQSLREKGYKVRSINSMLASVNSFLNYVGYADCKVKNIRLQHQSYCSDNTELTKAEYLRLLDATKGNEQMRLVLQAICATGIRVSELQYFTLDAIRHGKISINCKGKIRTILIPTMLQKLLMTYAKRKSIGNGPIFTGRNKKPLNRSCIWRKMKQLCQAAGVAVTKVFPHNLRKLFARTFYQMEKDIAKLADILGHSSINTTRIYIMTTGVEHRQKINRLGLIFLEHKNAT